MAFAAISDPVNFAPALLTDHCRVGGRKGPAAGESPEAWAYFLHRISAAHPDWPLAAAYDEVERIKAQMGWHWPSRATIYNRWNAPPQSVQLTLRFGAAKAAEMMRQGGQVMRDDIEIRLVFTLTPEEAARFHGRGVLMITPIQEAEIATLKAMFLGLRDFLAFNARNLATLNESLESGKITGARAAVARMLEPSRQAVQTHDAMLQILGRSKFVGGDEYGSVTEGTVQ
jgi:hypothetical protein